MAAHGHDSQVGWLIVLLSALLHRLRALVVIAAPAYFDGRMFKFVHDFLGAHPAIRITCSAQAKVNWQLFLSRMIQRLVIVPRTAIECHFAWMKRYFGSAVALTAQRYQCPDLYRGRTTVWLTYDS